MSTSKSSLGSEQITAALVSGDGPLALSALEEIEEQAPSRFLAQTLQNILPKVSDPITAFQATKTLKILLHRLSGKPFDTSLDQLKELLAQPEKMDELAWAISTLNPTDSFLATDMLRESSWQEFPPQVLPTFCRFFKRFGGVSDAQPLIELSRHSDPTVMTSALTALEVLDPANLQGLITPLLNSPNSGIRAKAIQTLYRYDKATALHHLNEMLFSKKETEKILALHHSVAFPFPEVEPLLFRFVSENDDPKLLIRVSLIFKANAHPELPFKIYWVFRTLSGKHKDLVKGLLIGIIRSLSEKKIISETPDEFLANLKVRIQQEEENRLRNAMEVPLEGKPIPGAPNAGSTAGQAADSKAHPNFNSIEDYEKLDITNRVQVLAKLSSADFSFFKTKVPGLLKTASGKELASILRVVGRFGKRSDAEYLRSCLLQDDPDVVSASIEALATLDTEYLSIFLPQLMQSKNGKIRMKATRAFVGIDGNQIKSLIAGMLSSSSPKQRVQAIPIATLVDFSIVRTPLLKALEKEPSAEIAEKIGHVLCANPDRELLRFVFRVMKKTPRDLGEVMKEITRQLAEKLSVALGKTSSAEELLAAEEKALTAEIVPMSEPASPSSPDSGQGRVSQISKSRSESTPTVQEIFTSDAAEAKEKRANLTVIILGATIIGWMAMLGYIFSGMLFGT